MKENRVHHFLKIHPDAARTLQEALSCERIMGISPISKGSTNVSYLVETSNKRYVLRIPGADSNSYIDRRTEKRIYELISEHCICDRVVYMNADNGHKLSEYCENARHLDLSSETDLQLFLATVKSLHTLKLQCAETYDFFESILKYERRSKTPGWFSDYADAKKDVFSLQSFTLRCDTDHVLIHNDLSPENCLFFIDPAGKERCILIDFEYAAMQSPMADIAYFCVFANLNEARTDHVIDLYFEGQTPPERRAEVYVYIALNALLHSNWLGTKDVSGEKQDAAKNALQMCKLYYQKAIELLR